MFGLEGAAAAAVSGVVGGAALGLAARLGHFCMMGAVEDAVYGGDLARMRMLAFAAGTAILATHALIALGALDPDATLYLRTGWSPMAAVLGGLMFGYGMAQVGTCGFGTLARLGGGDLRALLMMLVMGMAGYATLAGPLSGLRTLLAPPEMMATGQASLADWFGQMAGVPAMVPAALIGLAFLWLALSDRAISRRPGGFAWALVVGLAIAFAWAATSFAGATGFDIVPVEAFSFVAPLGETVLYTMTEPELSVPSFAIASVIGVVGGAALGSLWRGEHRWEACDDARELRRQLAGAALMGVGGVLAVGCSVGQGLSALSVLSTSAPVVILSIFAGARLGLFVLVEGMAPQR